ncbi:MAG: hypothetical protein NTX79_07875 [Candidatus Micrarchaeota archaeon]|nr:hypothetical protein [Candidatus Micrarchaeota archaeon]
MLTNTKINVVTSLFKQVVLPAKAKAGIKKFFPWAFQTPETKPTGNSCPEAERELPAHDNRADLKILGIYDDDDKKVLDESGKPVELNFCLSPNGKGIVKDLGVASLLSLKAAEMHPVLEAACVYDVIGRNSG